MRRVGSGCCARVANGIAAAPPNPAMNSRRLMSPPQERDIVAVQRSILEGAEVRYGSKADIQTLDCDVCFTSESGHQWMSCDVR